MCVKRCKLTFWVFVPLLSFSFLTNRSLAAPGFTYTGPLKTARIDDTATLLNSGRVLITGGQRNNTYLKNCEFYDPVTGGFTVTGTIET